MTAKNSSVWTKINSDLIKFERKNIQIKNWRRLDVATSSVGAVASGNVTFVIAAWSVRHEVAGVFVLQKNIFSKFNFDIKLNDHSKILR